MSLRHTQCLSITHHVSPSHTISLHHTQIIPPLFVYKLTDVLITKPTAAPLPLYPSTFSVGFGLASGFIYCHPSTSRKWRRKVVWVWKGRLGVVCHKYLGNSSSWYELLILAELMTFTVPCCAVFSTFNVFSVSHSARYFPPLATQFECLAGLLINDQWQSKKKFDSSQSIRLF